MIMKNLIRLSAALGIVIALSLVAGCSKQEPAPAAAPAPPPAATPVPVATPKPTPQWLATAQGETQGVTVAVQELRRRPNALMLKVAVINHSYHFYYFHGSDQGFSATHLIDEANQKKYFVVRDAEGSPSCSRDPDIADDSQVILWAEFPLPPDDVQKINVLVPKFQPMEDVPISH